MNKPSWMMYLCLGLVFSLGLSACSTPASPPPATSTPIPTDTSAPAPTDTPEPGPTATPLPIPVQPSMSTFVPPSGEPLPHLQPGQAVIISRISMFDVNNGWAIGGQPDPDANILVTSDGGQTWKDVTPPEVVPAEGQSHKIASATFNNKDVAWVLYYYQSYQDIPNPAIVWRTGDGGETWVASPLPMIDQVEFFFPSNFTLLDSLHGWLMVSVGAGMSHDYTILYRTVNGGISWEILIDPYRGDELQICDKNAMVFADREYGWITRNCMGLLEGGEVLKTEDGGASWQALDLPAPQDAPDLLSFPNYCRSHSPNLLSADRLMLALDCTKSDDQGKHQYSYTYFTEDGGNSWTVLPSPGGDLFMHSPTIGFLTGREIYTTVDSGGEWFPVKTVNWDGDFNFVELRAIWAVARSGNESALVVSNDFAKTWSEIKPVIGP